MNSHHCAYLSGEKGNDYESASGMKYRLPLTLLLYLYAGLFIILQLSTASRQFPITPQKDVFHKSKSSMESNADVKITSSMERSGESYQAERNPGVRITKPMAGSIIEAEFLEVKLSGNAKKGEISKYRCAVNDPDKYREATGNVFYFIVPDGNLKIYAQVVDESGNSSDWVMTEIDFLHDGALRNAYTLNSIDYQMVEIKPGEFCMGVAGHRRPVRLTKSFYIGSKEVTCRQWIKVMGRKPYPVRGDDYPIVNVSWLQALTFCNKLTEAEGLKPYYYILGDYVDFDPSADGYRLPTQHEWEHACRAGNTMILRQEDWENRKPQCGNCVDRSSDDEAGENVQSDERAEIMPVGSFRPNSWGLFDMRGNVEEWCWGMDDMTYMDVTAYNPCPVKIDPDEPAKGKRSLRKGGSFRAADYYNEPCAREKPSDIHYYSPSLGFRIAGSIINGGDSEPSPEGTKKALIPEIQSGITPEGIRPTLEFVKTPAARLNLRESQCIEFRYKGYSPRGMADYRRRMDDGRIVETMRSIVQFSNLETGDHIFSVTGQDSAGVYSRPISFHFSIFNAPPEAIIIRPEKNQFVEDVRLEVTVSGIDDGNKIAAYRCALNTMEVYTEQSTGVFHFKAEDGDNAVYAQVIDDAGNESPWTSCRIRFKNAGTPGGIHTIRSIVYEMARIDPGKFLMGSPPEETDRMADEKQHMVAVTTPFYMGVTEVAQAQWMTIMEDNPSFFVKEEYPVDSVSWSNAVKFCNKLSEIEGLIPVYSISRDKVIWNQNADGYRLPTEAEWEYSCRAGSSTKFCFGDAEKKLHKYGNYCSKSCEYRWKKTEYDDAYYGVSPVKSFKPNKWGLFDMHGNVWEWCWDWKGPYPSGPASDPVGPPKGFFRIRRGGSWFNMPEHCRSAFRGSLKPDARYYIQGFRLAKNGTDQKSLF